MPQKPSSKDIDELVEIYPRGKQARPYMRLARSGDGKNAKGIFLNVNAKFALGYAPYVTVKVHPVKPIAMVCRSTKDAPNAVPMSRVRERTVYSTMIYEKLETAGFEFGTIYYGESHEGNLIFYGDRPRLNLPRTPQG